mmetsp:Transcript_16840/g.16092  ORF Transcript_16840/g.16092 Transcript_16840/m.16092 type:complete len:111 (-) Transcript_16840:49-381(-)
MLRTNFSLGSEKAYNGQQGLDKFVEMRNKSKDRKMIIFMDISMPVMDGFECTKLIRDHEKDSNLPQSYIIGLSAHNSSEMMAKGKESGMNEFMMKPVKVGDIRMILNSLK